MNYYQVTEIWGLVKKIVGREMKYCLHISTLVCENWESLTSSCYLLLQKGFLNDEDYKNFVFQLKMLYE